MLLGAFAAVAFAGLLPLPLEAREPVKSVEDLAKLESQVQAVAAKVMPATVALVADKIGASGSGVVVSAEGLILTAAHVVQGTEELQVVFPDGKEVTGKVLGANLSKDIGMVKIVGGGNWPFVQKGESKPLQAGDWVVALGHSAGFDPARTPPVRFGRVVSKGPGNFLTTDCTLIGGDSGGPLFDLSGKVVGINSSIGMSLKNNNHAGIDGFRDDWDRLLAGEQWGRLSMNPFANPDMPVLGIGMAPPRPRQRGVGVANVMPGSGAANAGIKPGDVLVSFDGAKLAGNDELLILLAKHLPEDQVKVGIDRKGSPLEVTVTLDRQKGTLGRSARGIDLSDFAEEDIPLLRPEERQVTERQEAELFSANQPLVRAANQSTVWVWAGGRRPVSFGTVVGDGSRIVTKWSEIARGRDVVQIVDSAGAEHTAKLTGVYEDEDLAVLTLEGAPLTPVQWATETPALGHFLIAADPKGLPAGFGVVSVRERNLKETDQAFLGIAADPLHSGPGAKIGQIEERSAAAAAGVKAGDVILAIDNRVLSGLRELRSALSGKSPGDSVELKLSRNGQERSVKVQLARRPDLPEFTNPRLRQMEQMGGAISLVRQAFPKAIQTDMQIQPDQCGGPVVDLNGRVIGVLAARADRTRSFVIPASEIVAMLNRPAADPAVAKVRVPDDAMEATRIAAAGRRERPMVPPGSEPLDRAGAERVRRHFNDMQRLLQRLDEEMGEVGE
ncbi:MAG TPA: trypsin-like peptidase domain-containing protein [Luteolibacter sp.]